MEEESKQQQQQNLLLQIRHQQQLQQRQQQLFMMQHLQNQQQQRPISLIPSNTDAHLRPSGMIQNPFLQNTNPKPSSGPNLMQQNKNFQQQQPEVMMMMMQQRQEKSMRPLNHLEMQFAYQDAWRVCNPDFKRPFDSLEDACERLLPYHVVADYEAEEDDIILDSNATSQTLSRSQQWDNNIATKVAEFTAKFEKQAQDFNKITQKRSDGELRAEERLMVEQILLQDERKTCIDLKSELDKERKTQEERIRMRALGQAGGLMGVSQQQSHSEMMMAQEEMMRMSGLGQLRGESQQSQTEMMMMARNQLRANAIGNHGEQRRNINPDEMMMMMARNQSRANEIVNHGDQRRNINSNEMMMARNQLRANAIWNHGEQRRNINPYEMMMMNKSSHRDEKEALEEDFLNDEENENGGFDLNTL